MLGGISKGDIMKEWSQDNILILTAATTKKGNGINSIIGLLQDTIAFQDKIGAAVEAQDLGDNKKKLEDFHQKLGEMYNSLLEMAKGGVRSIRQDPQEMAPGGEAPFTMNDNSIQQIP